jgi:hypothetical protein
LTSWLENNLQGMCSCLFNFSSIKKKCDVKECPGNSLRELLLKPKKPTKLALIEALILTGTVDTKSIEKALQDLYGGTKKNTFRQYIYIVKGSLEKRGYSVIKNKDYYLVRKK